MIANNIKSILSDNDWCTLYQINHRLHRLIDMQLDALSHLDSGEIKDKLYEDIDGIGFITWDIKRFLTQFEKDEADKDDKDAPFYFVKKIDPCSQLSEFLKTFWEKALNRLRPNYAEEDAALQVQHDIGKLMNRVPYKEKLKETERLKEIERLSALLHQPRVLK